MTESWKPLQSKEFPPAGFQKDVAAVAIKNAVHFHMKPKGKTKRINVNGVAGLSILFFHNIVTTIKLLAF